MYSAWLEKAKRAAELEAPVVEDTGEDSQRAIFLETSPEQPFLGPFPAPSQASSSGPSGPGASQASFEPLKRLGSESWERSSRGS